MLAPWADEVFRKLFPNIFVAADYASPDSLSLWSGVNLFRFWLDVALIEFVGDRLVVRENFHICDLTDEESMRAQVYTFLDFN